MLSGRRAGGRPAKEAGQPRRRQEGTKAGGGGGSWRPTNWLPAKPGELLGNSSARLKCQGQRNRRTAGAEMWVMAAPGLRGAGWRDWPGRPHDATGPRTPSGKEEAAGEAGAPSPPNRAWASTQPSRWLGRRPAGPSPAPQPDTGESGTASSLFPEEAESRQASPPGIPPQAACKAGAGLMLFVFRQTGFPSPPSLCPRDISFPQIPSSGFPQAEMGPQETRNQTWESPR